MDDVGMFVVIKLRDDIEKAKEVAAEIRKGALRGFSIGGQAFKRVRKSDRKHGDYQEISKLELHEITICEKGINPEATFRILKEDTKEQNKVKKMTEDDTMNQMTDVLSRLETRLDSMEKGEKPAFLEDKKDEGKDSKKESKDKDDAKKSDTEYSDVISSDYLNWMEDTLKSAGVDTVEARAHFDGDSVAKQNMGSTPGELQGSDVTNGGQAPLRQQEGGNPSTGAVGKLNSGGDVKKSDFLNPMDLDASDVEAAYEVYKAAALEQEFRGSLESDFAARYHAERTEEIAKAEAASYDARGPLDAITKAIAELSERIDSIGTPAEVGETLQKSAAPQHEVPSTSDLAQMSWEEVHQLAGRVFEGE